MIAGLHHVQITVPSGDEDQARDFYGRLLGLREVPKPKSLTGRGGLWLDLGGQQLHIGTEDGMDRNATKAHLAYRVTGLGAWRERLTAAGLKILESVPIPGFQRFEARDPFGNRLEFIEPLEEPGRVGP